MQVKSIAFGEDIRLGAADPAGRDVFRVVTGRLPRPARFLLVGGVGLSADIGIFTAISMSGMSPLSARLVSLVLATLITWQLNRALTFDRSGRRPHHEALRYAAVTAVAQGTSYATFAVLMLTFLAGLPQAAIAVGAACGAILSYNGHRLFAFAPVTANQEHNSSGGVYS